MKFLYVRLIQFVLLLVFQQLTTLAEDCLPLRVGNPEGNYIVPGVRCIMCALECHQCC